GSSLRKQQANTKRQLRSFARLPPPGLARKLVTPLAFGHLPSARGRPVSYLEEAATAQRGTASDSSPSVPMFGAQRWMVVSTRRSTWNGSRSEERRVGKGGRSWWGR